MQTKKLPFTKKAFKKAVKKAIASELDKLLPITLRKVLDDRKKAEIECRQTPEYKKRQYQAAVARLEWYFHGH